MPGDGLSHAVSLASHQAARDRLEKLIELGHVASEDDVHGSGGRQLYRLAEAG